MKTSVIVALYNGEKYLIEQLESILNQTRKADEVILCDDGSTDSTISVCNNFIEENGISDSWRIVINDRNLGYADNFIQNVPKTSGDIVFFCDQDDIWSSNKIEETLSIMGENESIKLLCTEFEPYICTDDAPSIPKQFMQYMNNNGTLEKLELSNKTIFIGSEGCVMSFRRSFFDEIIKYHYHGWAHDEFMWEMALAANGCFYYHKPLIKRRMHSSNVSKQKIHNKEKRIKFLSNLGKGQKKMLEYASVKGLSAEGQNLIVQNIEAARLRTELIEKRKLINSVKLAVFHNMHYQSRKSVLMELIMAIKG